MTTINETISTSLRNSGLAGYERQAQPIVDALVQREQSIVSDLLEAARDGGFNVDDVARTFEGVGLAMPVQQPQQAGVETVPAGTMDRLAALEQFARANGFRG